MSTPQLHYPWFGCLIVMGGQSLQGITSLKLEIVSVFMVGRS